jgi:hypothetical protein
MQGTEYQESGEYLDHSSIQTVSKFCRLYASERGRRRSGCVFVLGSSTHGPGNDNLDAENRGEQGYDTGEKPGAWNGVHFGVRRTE